MKITELWFEPCITNEAGEEYRVAEIGEVFQDTIVIDIIEHRAAGEGDKWYYDIYFKNGTSIRTFAPYRVNYKED